MGRPQVVSETPGARDLDEPRGRPSPSASPSSWASLRCSTSRGGAWRAPASCCGAAPRASTRSPAAWATRVYPRSTRRFAGGRARPRRCSASTRAGERRRYPGVLPVRSSGGRQHHRQVVGHLTITCSCRPGTTCCTRRRCTPADSLHPGTTAGTSPPARTTASTCRPRTTSCTSSPGRTSACSLHPRSPTSTWRPEHTPPSSPR